MNLFNKLQISLTDLLILRRGGRLSQRLHLRYLRIFNRHSVSYTHLDVYKRQGYDYDNTSTKYNSMYLMDPNEPDWFITSYG